MINSISNTMRTGNIVLDTMLLSMIPILINLVFSYGKYIITVIVEYFKKQSDKMFKKPIVVEQQKTLAIRHQEVFNEANGKFIRDANGKLNPELFLAVMEEIEIDILRQGKDVSVTMDPGNFECDYMNRVQNICNVLPTACITYHFEKQPITIRYSQKNENDSNGNGHSFNKIRQTEMLLETADLELAMKFVNSCYKNWCVKHKKPPAVDPPKFIFALKRNNDYPGTLRFSESRFNSNKHFGCLFFPEKDFLLKSLDCFMNNPGMYQKRGIPLKESCLLFGEPGTGKTSFIKALANKLGRHIFMIDLRKISSDTLLQQLFFSENIVVESSNGNAFNRCIPISKRIYVIEEIDTMGSIVRSRQLDVPAKPDNKSGNKSDSDSDSENENKVNKDIGIHASYPKHRRERLSLYGLLNCLDGISELHNGIIVMTTNHVEKLDPALIREGRINHKIYLTKMRQPEIKQMLEYHFDNPDANGSYNSIPPEDVAKLPDNLLEPSKVEFKIKNCANLQEAVELLKNVNTYNQQTN